MSFAFSIIGGTGDSNKVKIYGSVVKNSNFSRNNVVVLKVINKDLFSFPMH